MDQDYDVVIIGAGASGLVCAHHLDKAGLNVLCLERDSRPGGRLQTDEVKGFKLDRGFQVLLTAYEEVNRYLHLDSLKLGHFEPGAYVHTKNRTITVEDPMRHRSALLRMLLSSVGTIGDKVRLWRLVREVVEKNDEDLFAASDLTTQQFLEAKGFSIKIIEHFFRPFFGGIFLENELTTSASQFLFVFKKFSMGFASVPAEGMQAVANHLKNSCRRVEFRFNTAVKKIADQKIWLENGESIGYKKLAVACNPESLFPTMQNDATNWNSTSTLYFESTRSPLARQMLALNSNNFNAINNWCVLSDVQPALAPSGKHLLCVSLRGNPDVHDNTLIQQVSNELQILSGLKSDEFSFLKLYRIPEALPSSKHVLYTMPYTQCKLTDNVYLAGDYLLNPSLDAALRSGRNCATAILKAD